MVSPPSRRAWHHAMPNIDLPYMLYLAWCQTAETPSGARIYGHPREGPIDRKKKKEALKTAPADCNELSMMAARELSNIVRGGYSASAKAALRFPVGGGATLALASCGHASNRPSHLIRIARRREKAATGAEGCPRCDRDDGLRQAGQILTADPWTSLRLGEPAASSRTSCAGGSIVPPCARCFTQNGVPFGPRSVLATS